MAKFVWQIRTRSVLRHCMLLCVTPPVLPSALQVQYCPGCHQLRVYQVHTKLVCETTSAERAQEVACERYEHPGPAKVTPTAKTLCGSCHYNAKGKVAKGIHRGQQGDSRQEDLEDNTRYGREMFRRFSARKSRDRAAGADLQYHGQHYDC